MKLLQIVQESVPLGGVRLGVFVKQQRHGLAWLKNASLSNPGHLASAPAMLRVCAGLCAVVRRVHCAGVAASVDNKHELH